MTKWKYIVSTAMKHIRIYTLALLAAVLYRQSYGQGK